MLKKTIKYTLLSVTLWGISACTTPTRTIMINQERTRPIVREPIYRPATQQPVIQEEVLLGRGTKNESLGNRVKVPVNRPVLEEPEETVTVPDTPVVHNEVIERMPFPVNEYKYIKKRGNSTVSGKIYLENAHTSLKVNGKKIKLWLNPVTSYSRQWYEESYLGGYKLSKTDKRLYNYLKFTYSDSAGNFNFFGVPSGDYYLTGSISCGEECGFSETKSIRLVREISVGRGTTTVDLTKSVP